MGFLGPDHTECVFCSERRPFLNCFPLAVSGEPGRLAFSPPAAPCVFERLKLKKKKATLSGKAPHVIVFFFHCPIE